MSEGVIFMVQRLFVGRVCLIGTNIIETVMEKIGKRMKASKDRQKLPSLPQNKSHLHVVHAPTPELMGSTERLKDLRKLYFQYKSNANILKHSPYYTNRQQQRQVIAFIHANKYELDAPRIAQLTHQFTMPQSQAAHLNSMPITKITVKLLVLGAVIELNLQVRSVGEMDCELRKEFALQEYRMTGQNRKADTICGFQSVGQSATIDYQLSLKDIQPLQEHYYLKPIFSELPKGSVKLINFRLVRCLGSGGFSLVWLARQGWSGQFFALKLIDKKFILDSERETIVQNQRYVLGELQSPFITGLRYSFQTKNHFAFLVEYCPGGELFFQLKKVKRMTEQQAKFYFLEILIGLDYIHQKNIVYRDLKPQNLLIAADGHIKIADFGLAKPLLAGPRKQAYSFCGSPQYMAPEMLLKSGHSFTLDYYCLGALLYELVIGIPPYYSLNHEQIYRGILHDDLTFPSHTFLSDQIKSLLRGLLQKNPTQRLGHLYGVREILVHPWVGKVSRKSIEEKQLIPPFMPDLTTFNFDESELAQRAQQINPKLEEDIKTQRFQTHFNSQFYFEDHNLTKMREEKGGTKVKKVRKLLSNNKENRGNKSLDSKPKQLKRIFSQKDGLRI